MDKYRIRIILSTLPPPIRKTKRQELMNGMNIKKSRLYSLLAAQRDDSVQMTAEQLIAAAEVLGCTAEELINNTLGAANIQNHHQKTLVA